MLNTIEPVLGGFVEHYGCLVMLVPGAYVRSEPKRRLHVLFQNDNCFLHRHNEIPDESCARHKVSP